MLVAMTLFTIATICCIWIPFGGSSATALYIVGFCMGVGTGAFVPLSGKVPPTAPVLVRRGKQPALLTPDLATCISRLCANRGYGKWLGSCYAIVSFA